METEYCVLQCRLDYLPDDSVTIFWKKLLGAKNSVGVRMFLVLSQLAISLLIFPVSHAVVEGVFSHLTLTKMDLQNRMFLDTFEKFHVKFGVRRNGRCCKDFTLSDIVFERSNTTVIYSRAAVCLPKE
ncbi:hypothetical protein HPB48_018049 [Haemaphysalis longicornis]|uniref:HAT C-terminal dimerisation domain-containing protein n=1 Tax=Haemaphysalis longicornis TaxID=44386 RepID=A0A9J6FR14_HAELO|nr:hypothetical protein HPB48_018049 [Haemaphysalis longicornis]